MRLLLILIFVSSISRAAEDGKVFLKSEPPGADVFVISGPDDKEQKLLGKTPGIIKLPEGTHKLMLRLNTFADTFTEIEVKGTAIMKPEPVKLRPLTYALDVIFPEEGWQILVDQTPQVENGKNITTPATISVLPGTREIRLMKTGYRDIVRKIEVKKNHSIEITEKPQKSLAAGALPAKAERKWISKQAVYKVSSTLESFTPKNNLLDGSGGGYMGAGGDPEDTFSFHTTLENAPWLLIDLKAVLVVESIGIANRKDSKERASRLTAWVGNSEKGPWAQIWQATEVKPEWEIVLKEPVAVRYIKLGLKVRNMLHLSRVMVYGR